jgi:hypothetical protein
MESILRFCNPEHVREVVDYHVDNEHFDKDDTTRLCSANYNRCLQLEVNALLMQSSFERNP